jgi:thymidylate synthase
MLSPYTRDFRPYTQEEFINKCKTDPEFSEKWGLKIEERELSFEERYVILKNKTNEDPLKYSKLNNGDYDQYPKEMTTKWMDELNIPTRAISLMWNQRSVDTFLGLPFNIASYGLLLEIIAKEVNMVPDELIGNLGDVHLYSNHKEQAVEQIGREPFELPTLEIHSSKIDDIAHHEIADFEIKNYQSHPSIKAPLSN